MEKKYRCIQQKWLINCSTNIPNSNKTFRALEFSIFKMNKQSKRHTCYTGLSYLKFGIGFYLNAFKKATEIFHSDKQSHPCSVYVQFTVRCITTNKIEKKLLFNEIRFIIMWFCIENSHYLHREYHWFIIVKMKNGHHWFECFSSPRSPHIDFNFSLSDFSVLGLGLHDYGSVWFRFITFIVTSIRICEKTVIIPSDIAHRIVIFKWILNVNWLQ